MVWVLADSSSTNHVQTHVFWASLSQRLRQGLACFQRFGLWGHTRVVPW